MNDLKAFGIEFLIIAVAVVLFIGYLLKIKSDGKKEGKLEQLIENLQAKQKTIKEAARARREFGSTKEALEYDDTVQFKNTPNYKPVEIISYSPEHCDIKCLQYGQSPFTK